MTGTGVRAMTRSIGTGMVMILIMQRMPVLRGRMITGTLLSLIIRIRGLLP